MIHLAFSELAKPLNDLLKKDQTFKWTDNCQKAFEELKKRFTEEPVLMMPDHSRSKQMPPNMQQGQFSLSWIRMVIDTQSPSSQKHFHKRNYEIYDWELLAIIRALEEWRHYIQGSPHTTIILSDHKNLTYY